MGIGQALDTILQFFSSGLFLNVLHFHQIHPSSGLCCLDRGSSRSATYSGIREGQGKRFFPQELRVSKRLLCRFCVLRGGSPTFKHKLCVTYQGSPQTYLFTFADCGHSSTVKEFATPKFGHLPPPKIVHLPGGQLPPANFSFLFLATFSWLFRLQLLPRQVHGGVEGQGRGGGGVQGHQYG